MKAIAEYVMRGPNQASLAVLIFGLIPGIGPWLCSAAISLVVLQVGFAQSIRVLIWALLPAGLWFYYGDVSFLMVLVATLTGAVVLRTLVSLPLATIAVVVVCSIAVGLLQLIEPQRLDPLVEMMTEVIRSSNNPALNKDDAEIEQSVLKIVSMAFAWGSGATACINLFIARWWQALLYKPGGFQKEFHSFKLSYLQVLVLLIAITLSSQIPEIGIGLASLLTMPLFIGGVAIIHALAKIGKVSAHWLGVFYLAILFLGQVIYLPLMLLAMLDVGLGFREKMRESLSEDDDEG